MFKWIGKANPVSNVRSYNASFTMPNGIEHNIQDVVISEIKNLITNIATQFVEDHKAEIVQGININNVIKSLNNEVETKVMEQYLGKLVTK